MKLEQATWYPRYHPPTWIDTVPLGTRPQAHSSYWESEGIKPILWSNPCLTPTESGLEQQKNLLSLLFRLVLAFTWQTCCCCKRWCIGRSGECVDIRWFGLALRGRLRSRRVELFCEEPILKSCQCKNNVKGMLCLSNQVSECGLWAHVNNIVTIVSTLPHKIRAQVNSQYQRGNCQTKPMTISWYL